MEDETGAVSGLRLPKHPHKDNHNKYFTATRDFHKVSVSPQPGQHTMTVVDEQGHTLSATIRVKE